MTPLISLCHASARLPHGWEKACIAWVGQADNPAQCEYIVGSEQPIPTDILEFLKGRGVDLIWKQNRGRACAVDAWNATAECAHGKLIITVSDDWFPPDHWDTRLLECVPDLNVVIDARHLKFEHRDPARGAPWDEIYERQRGPGREKGVEIYERRKGEYVLDVDNQDGSYPLLPFSILTTTYYKKLGYLFNPEYFGNMADVEFTEVARRDGKEGFIRGEILV